MRSNLARLNAGGAVGGVDISFTWIWESSFGAKRCSSVPSADDGDGYYRCANTSA